MNNHGGDRSRAGVPAENGERHRDWIFGSLEIGLLGRGSQQILLCPGPLDRYFQFNAVNFSNKVERP